MRALVPAANGTKALRWSGCTGSDTLGDALLAGDDPEQTVALLCSKFSGLIDQVQAAECSQALARERAVALGSRLRSVVAKQGASDAGKQATLREARREANAAQRRLLQVKAHALRLTDEVRQTQEEIACLEMQCDTLSMQCQEEDRAATSASDEVACCDTAWQECEKEHSRLRSEVDRTSAELIQVEEELTVTGAREHDRKADLRAMEERVRNASRARHAAERKLDAQREEVREVVQQVAIHGERFDAVWQLFQDREESLREEHARFEDLHGQLRQQETAAVVNSEGLAKVGKVKAALEAALRENVETHERLNATKLELSTSSGCNTTLRVRQVEAEEEAQLELADRHLATARVELAQGRQQLCELRNSVQSARAQQNQLELESAPLALIGENLQAELQRALAETENYRLECNEVAAEVEQLQRRLRSVEPALESMRHRMRALETALESAEEEAMRARKRKEGLMREVAQSRDKMRRLRKRHEQLTEKAPKHQREQSRPQGRRNSVAPSRSTTPGPVPSMRAAAERVAGSTSRALCSAPSTPRKGTTLSGPPFSAGARSLPEQPILLQASPARAGASGLSYLRRWVESEEARLFEARTPPIPIPTPVPAVAASTVPSGCPPPSSCRTAAALAALTSGAGPSEALALLGLEGVGDTSEHREESHVD